MQNDDSIFIQKETNEAKEILKDYLAKEQKKITRIPFYRLEEVKKIEEKKLKNIHKTEKKEKEKEKSNQLLHRKSLIERRKTKKTKKQKENLSSKHQKNNNNEIETSSIDRSQSSNSILIDNQGISFSNNTKNSNDSTPIYLRKNNPNIMHDLKYSHSTIFPSKREMRLSKKQQKLQNAENTIGSFLTPENKIQISNLMNSELNKNNLFDYNKSKNENNKNYYYKNIKKGYKNNSKSDSKLYHVPFEPIFEPEEINDNNNEENEISFSNEENEFDDNNISLDEEKDIIEEKKEEHEDEKSEENKKEENNDKDNDNNDIKFGELKKKHKRLSKFKKAVLKYRLQKKKYLYNKIFTEYNFNNEKNEIDLKIENNHLKDNEIKENKNTIKNNDYHIFQNSSLFDYYNNLNQSDDYESKYNNQNNNYYYYFNNDYPYNYSLNNYMMYNQYNQYYYFNPTNKFSFETFINEKKNKIKENNFVYGKTNQKGNNMLLNNEKKIYPEPGKILIMDLQKKIKENDNKEIQLFSFEQNKNQNNKIEKEENKEIKISEEEKKKNFEKFKENLNKEYQFDTLDIDNLNGKELNDYLKKHKNIDKITINQLKTILPKEDLEEYMKNFEGIENPKQKHLIREYVDQFLDNKLDEKFSNFIIKLRDLYYKKKTNAPLKAKKRFVVGMREIEKYLRLKELLCLFIVPNIEKVKDEKNSLDLRILDIINKCRTNEIPILFGLNKYKLGKISRKKISCVSMLGIVDVKGLEKELKDIVEYGEHFRRDWYIKNYNNKDQFKDNQYILMDTFDYYQNQLKNSNEGKI